MKVRVTKRSAAVTDIPIHTEYIKLQDFLKFCNAVESGGMAKNFDPDQIDEKQMARTQAIIRAMTPQERRRPDILNASRRKRIAKGCGLQIQDVNRLLNQYEQSKKLMKQFGGMGKKGKKRFGGMRLPF